MAGYSGKSLADKLGLKPGMMCWIINAPKTYQELLGVMSSELKYVDGQTEQPEFIHLFVTQAQELAKLLPQILSRLPEKGSLWLSWPKKSSKQPTDLTENTLREIGLPLGIVDVKVCAIDEIWSGLKFVWRKKP